ncbi:hypothetical protein L7F22_017056 [Adiantum nelumboides]|nr:hypothetical protein [Adiantum nelumboides]
MQACNRAVKEDSFSYLKSLCANGRLRDAIRSAETLHKQGIRVPIHVLFHLLKTCISEPDLTIGRELHSLVVNTGLGNNAFLACHLIRMFSSCHSLPDAKQTFISLPTHLHTVYIWNAIISAHIKHGHCEDAIGLYHVMTKSGLQWDKHIFVATLKACSNKFTITHGREIHSDIVKYGFELDLIVCNTLVAMYIKSGSIDDAHLAFRSTPVKDVVTWNALISGYAQHGHGLKALYLFMDMYRDRCNPTLVTYLCLIKACASSLSLQEGRLIHGLIVKDCLEQEKFVGSSLIDMYSKCENVEDAHRVFDNLQTQDVATWNAVIQAFAQQGLANIAFKLFQDMRKKGFDPDNVTFLSILKACTSNLDFEQIKLIDDHIMQSRSNYDAYVASTLIDMYVKCGSIEHATRVFNSSRHRDTVTWNTMIGGWAAHHQFQKVLQLFEKMHLEGIEPDTLTYVSLLKASLSTQISRIGKLTHSCIVSAGFENETLVENSIVDMYAKFGSMEDAYALFRRFPRLDAISWNTLLSGYVQHEQSLEALQIYQSMQQGSIEPDKATLTLMLKACSSKSTLYYGKLVHVQIVESGFESDTLVQSTLIDLYAKGCSMDDARGVFTRTSKQCVHAWNMLLSGYVHCDKIQMGLEVFANMQEDMIQPNETTIISVLQACSSLEVLEPIMLLNDLIIRRNFEQDIFVMSALIDVYAKYGSLAEALNIFVNIPKPGVVTWTVLISGHVQHGNGLQALQFFYQMQSQGIEPNEATFVCAVKACIILESMEQGNLVHDCSIRNGLPLNEVMGSALINLYVTSGSLQDAFKVFSRLPNRDTVAWNVIISGLVRSNDHEMALQHFEEMQLEGVQPDNVNFVSLLAGCSHLGLICEGFDIFESISRLPSVLQMTDYFNCLIDLLGRTGHLSKAEDVLEALPSSCSSLGWKSLLGHCQTHCKVQLGKRCYNRLVELGLADASVYKLMLNIYSCAGMKEDADTVEELRPAEGSVEVQSRMYDFVVRNQIHAVSDTRVYILPVGMQKDKGYMPLLDTLLEQDQFASLHVATECG